VGGDVKMGADLGWSWEITLRRCVGVGGGDVNMDADLGWSWEIFVGGWVCGCPCVWVGVLKITLRRCVRVGGILGNDVHWCVCVGGRMWLMLLHSLCY